MTTASRKSSRSCPRGQIKWSPPGPRPVSRTTRASAVAYSTTRADACLAYLQSVAGWLGEEELRIGLGCMRVEPEMLRPTVAAALAAGITVFDTAHAYGEKPGDNERLVGQALRGARARVVTKGGMTRAGTAWVPDGRAAAIRQHCEASLAALDGVGIDLYLLHAPDPGV